MTATRVGLVQKVKSGALGWWILGTVFLASAIGLYLLSGPVGPFRAPQPTEPPAASGTICAGSLVKEQAPDSGGEISGFGYLG